MAYHSRPAKRSLLLVWVFVVCLSLGVLAQDQTTSEAPPGETATTATDLTTTEPTTTAEETAPTTATTDPAETTSEAPPTTTEATEPTTSELPPATTESTSETSTATTDPASSTTETSSDGNDPPLPTIIGQYSYPPPTVPPTNNAPFMQPADIPEGTFFIAVGAILGAIGAAVLIWRAVVACLLHRSVKRAAHAQHMANDKAPFAAGGGVPPPAPFYKYNDHESSLSVANASAGRGVRRTTRGPIPSATPSQTNLFFSPTAPGANAAGNRESRFLPSGFYAAGSGSQQGHEHSISLTNLRPDSHGHARAVGITPPESPALAPRADPARRNVSTTSLALNTPTGNRAPSAYLEDLLADQPEQFPPQGGYNHGQNQQQNRF